ncbi:MAG: phosphate-starvation-inducible E-like protein [Calditrichaeota bacterium]|nr:MAG: phosphate-starvation-inducible E-like protein [Calditrichota bacterium]
MMAIIERIERVIIMVMLVLMMITLILGTIELGIILFQEVMAPPVFILNLQKMIEVFGFFLMVLIGIELLESIKVYLKNNKFHLEIVFMVALIALARKITILDYNATSPSLLMGMASAVIALSAGYYLVKKGYTQTATTGDAAAKSDVQKNTVSE